MAAKTAPGRDTLREMDADRFSFAYFWFSHRPAVGEMTA
jgi:hypothetical protein